LGYGRKNEQDPSRGDHLIVKPMQLMMARSSALPMVGLTQFLLWVILTSAIYGVVMSMAMKDSEKTKMETIMKIARSSSWNGCLPETAASPVQEIADAVDQINFH
jgi:ABC-2 type transport system permease protein